MKLRTAVAAVAAALLLGVSLPATTPLMTLAEVRPGMVGVGRTVLQGTELQEFKVHILGVLKNVQGPRRDLILARLEGAGLEESAVTLLPLRPNVCFRAIAAAACVLIQGA